MDVGEDPDVVLARRLKLVVRLVFYPVAIGLVVLAVHVRHAAGERDGDLPAWHGLTSQGQPIVATGLDHWLDSLGVQLRESCDDGVTRSFHWTPALELFRQRGDVVTAHRPPRQLDDGNGWLEVYEGWLRIRLGDRPRGSVSLRDTYRSAGAVVRCHTGAVTFVLSRG